MRLRFITNFRLLSFQFQYIYITNFRSLRRRTSSARLATLSPDITSATLSKSGTLNGLFSRFSQLRTLKAVPAARSDWRSGDAYGHCSAVKLLQPAFTPADGFRQLKKGFDTRVSSFKQSSLFFPARRSLGWDFRGVENTYAVLSNASGIVKYRAKRWDSSLYSANFFFGQWSLLYQNARVHSRYNFVATPAVLDLNLAMVGEVDEGYGAAVDPRNNHQHTLNAALRDKFTEKLHEECSASCNSESLDSATSYAPNYANSRISGSVGLLRGGDLRTMYLKALPRKNTNFFWFFLLTETSRASSYLVPLTVAPFRGLWLTQWSLGNANVSQQTSRHRSVLGLSAGIVAASALTTVAVRHISYPLSTLQLKGVVQCSIFAQMLLLSGV